MSVLSGPFEIQEVIGEGAFGAVFVARVHDDPLRRRVALKVLKQEYVSNPKVLNRTRDEARLLSRIQHPNIVRVERLVDLLGRPAIVMELVHGVSLKRLLDRYPTGVPAEVALEVMRQTAVALHTAYHEGFGDNDRPLRVIHRDIKPSNMLLSVHGELKVVDFGIATGQFAEREAQTESLVMGSRPYMAPERLDGAADTPAVDIYSAGMSLYELLTGKLMNLSVSPGSHARSLGNYVDRLILPDLAPDLAEDIRQIVRRMCSYDVDYRPSARDTAAELGRLLDRLPSTDITGLADFSRRVVVPLYDARPRRPVDNLEDMLGGGIEGVRTEPHLRRRRSQRPLYFVAGLAALIVVLAILAGLKRQSAVAQAQDHSTLAGDIDVKVWIPADVGGRVGTSMLSAPGVLQLPPDAYELNVTLAGGEVVRCPFTARESIAIRYVIQDGKSAISIDDGPATLCAPVPDPEPADQAAPAAP